VPIKMRPSGYAEGRQSSHLRARGKVSESECENAENSEGSAGTARAKVLVTINFETFIIRRMHATRWRRTLDRVLKCYRAVALNASLFTALPELCIETGSARKACAGLAEAPALASSVAVVKVAVASARAVSRVLVVRVVMVVSCLSRKSGIALRWSGG
jgi:hypothetical protein